MNTSNAAFAVYRGFEDIVEHYNPPRNFSGHVETRYFDFFKFIGYELFVTFFSFLIRESHWELIAYLLEQDIYIDNPRIGSYGYEPMVVTFTYVSQSAELLNFDKHIDILTKRHTEGELAKLIPMQQFMDADFFLFLRAFQEAEVGHLWSWKAWSTLEMTQAPRYLLEASRAKYAQQLLRPLGVKDIETLRVCVDQGAAKLRQIHGSLYPFHPLGNFDPRSIGSR